jgi:hypothetical protein
MPTITNCVEFVWKGTLAETALSRNVWNVFHYRLVAGTLDAFGQLMGDFDTKVFSFARAQLTADYSTVSFNGRLLDDATQQFTTTTVALAGGIALPRLPGDLAIVTPMRCAQRGKQFRGRKHWRGVPSASVLKDELTAGALTAWLAVAVKLVGSFTSTLGTYQPCVVAKTLSQLRTNPTTIIASDVTSVLVNKTIGTFRRSKEPTQR